MFRRRVAAKRMHLSPWRRRLLVCWPLYLVNSRRTPTFNTIHAGCSWLGDQVPRYSA